MNQSLIIRSIMAAALAATTTVAVADVSYSEAEKLPSNGDLLSVARVIQVRLGHFGEGDR